MTYTVSADIMESIKHDFSDVLDDRLNPTPMKTDKPMQINLRENAKPLKVLEARRVPKRYEEPAEAAIKEGTLNFADIKSWNVAKFGGWESSWHNFVEGWKIADTFLGLEGPKKPIRTKFCTQLKPS